MEDVVASVAAVCAGGAAGFIAGLLSTGLPGIAGLAAGAGFATGAGSTVSKYLRRIGFMRLSF